MVITHTKPNKTASQYFPAPPQDEGLLGVRIYLLMGENVKGTVSDMTEILGTV